ncbi:hypothetical protein DL237_00985 [Pseudooceanicola sediminis]|uniref:Uncharacterized protein n=1 Tax=Pseudooceanicola sediminis TaxID=2211117 RepID=A0A399J5J5_9RHOB|nr:hypothetical protein [Pseudooceanicola sediminis]KAA2316923.1 hypothetical protein E0K93_00940 [Puniceibacterium sp. HSS470]RII40624.1 hypothetical protein DL237_00985 [Pseudooceanicola sediminis]|tara:strand:+ start:69128 stop:69655 length:528 start_codon:yes stop_codon:yes gene_type:complete
MQALHNFPRTHSAAIAPLIDETITEGLHTLTHGSASAGMPASTDVWTLALHCNPFRNTLSLSADTRSNSDEVVARMNTFSRVHFKQEIEDGNFASAQLWQANHGRNMGLSDFALPDIATRPLPETLVRGADFFLALTEGMMRHQRALLACCAPSVPVIFATTTHDEEIGMVWSAR